MAYTSNNHLSPLKLLTFTLVSLATLSAGSPAAEPNLPRETHEVNAYADDIPGFVGVESSRVAPPPAYTPITTPAPNQDAALLSQGYSQTTYYTCRTIDGREEETCGWHVPILKVEAAAPPTAMSTGFVAAAVGAGAALFVLGLL